MSTPGPVKAPEMSGRRFLLLIALPLFLAFAALFIAFGPDKPLGGKLSGMFAPPDFWVEHQKRKAAERAKAEPKP